MQESLASGKIENEFKYEANHDIKSAKEYIPKAAREAKSSGHPLFLGHFSFLIYFISLFLNLFISLKHS